MSVVGADVPMQWAPPDSGGSQTCFSLDDAVWLVAPYGICGRRHAICDVHTAPTTDNPGLPPDLGNWDVQSELMCGDAHGGCRDTLHGDKSVENKEP